MRKEREGKMAYQLEGHEDGVNCLAISSDDSVLVSGSEDNTARVWSIEDEEKEEELEDIDALFNDDDGDKEGHDAKEKESISNIENEDGDGESAKINDDLLVNEKSKESEPVSNSELINEGKSRCLGVLR